MTKLEKLTMQLVEAEQHRDKSEWMKVAGQIAELKGECDK